MFVYVERRDVSSCNVDALTQDRLQIHAAGLMQLYC